MQMSPSNVTILRITRIRSLIIHIHQSNRNLFLDAATSVRAMFVKIVEICHSKPSERCESPEKTKQLPIQPLPNGSRISWTFFFFLHFLARTKTHLANPALLVRCNDITSHY